MGRNMFERFTDRARKVMALANQEALQFHHEYIGTEHILLGLAKEESGVGAKVLKNLDVDLLAVRRGVEKLITAGPNQVPQSKLPQTPRAKKVIEYAIEEARNLNHNYVGTEHLLLGLLREHDGVAAQVLMNLGLKLEEVREEVLKLLGIDERPLFIDYSTPEAQQAADLAGQSARDMGHRAICTGHLLLGLLEEPQGLAARLLAKLGVTPQMVRDELVKFGGRESEG
jgi:ATP-dependent Clp protease ATP-binding subunit ClpA